PNKKTILLFIPHKISKRPFSDSLSLFAIGALMAAIATGITYLTYHFFDAETLKNEYFSEYYPIPFVLASYALFVCGLVSTSTAFNQL
ncbi:MAG: hypothetical protein OXK20_08560, partial [Deltaproteobacteria bacterium]|nr:hypothetical protein [Deltaproteobacteria bacterium]